MAIGKILKAFALLCFVISGCCGTDCPNGWMAYERSCYLFSYSAPVHFTEAEQYCQQNHNGHLVTVDNVQENAFIKSQLSHIDRHLPINALYGYWMGLKDEVAEGVWVWTKDDEPATFTDWGGPEPNGGQNENCAMFANWLNYSWNDSSCSGNNIPLCELTPSGIHVVG